MALLALSHTPIEHHLYRVMLSEMVASRKPVDAFGVRRLMQLTGLRSYSSIRRGCAGLIRKLSIEDVRNGEPRPRVTYRIFKPEEIFARRREAGLAPLIEFHAGATFNWAIEPVLRRRDLSRREAYVVLCCVEGLTNAEIGRKLDIGEQTVKFHLRHVFAKLGIKRRTELISRLLTQRDPESVRPLDDAHRVI